MTTLVVILCILTAYSTTAWHIRDRILLQDGGNIRLGITESEDETALGIKRFLTPQDEANESVPKTQIIPTQIQTLTKRSTERRFRLCGSRLHNMLVMVCTARTNGTNGRS